FKVVLGFVAAVAWIVVAVVAVVAVVWAIGVLRWGGSPPRGGRRSRVLLRPLGRRDRQAQGQLLLHLVPRRRGAAAARHDRRRRVPRRAPRAEADLPGVREGAAPLRPSLHSLRARS